MPAGFLMASLDFLIELGGIVCRRCCKFKSGILEQAMDEVASICRLRKADVAGARADKRAVNIKNHGFEVVDCVRDSFFHFGGSGGQRLGSISEQLD